jgi:hypothetical protein
MVRIPFRYDFVSYASELRDRHLPSLSPARLTKQCRYMMALVDTLDYFPASHPGHARLLTYLHSLADAVVLAQDPVYKGWYNIMDPGFENRSGNYIESSGSAMFVYGLFKGLRLGHLSGAKYEAAATSGYELMTSEFAKEDAGDGSLDWEWTVQVGSLSSNGTFEVSSLSFSRLRVLFGIGLLT